MGEAGNILEAHTGAKKLGGFTSLPLETGAMGLNDRMDFMNMFQKQINDMKLLSQKRTAAYYQYSMQAYWDFILEWEMQIWARVQAAYPL